MIKKKRKFVAITTLIDKDIVISLDTTYTGGIRIDGKINGNLKVHGEEDSLLIMGHGSKITGDVEVEKAIINGEIIVKLKANVSAEYIASIYEIILTNSFERIDTATYRVNSWQDIFTIAQQLNENAGVEFAELDVIEHFAQPN